MSGMTQQLPGQLTHNRRRMHAFPTWSCMHVAPALMNMICTYMRACVHCWETALQQHAPSRGVPNQPPHAGRPCTVFTLHGVNIIKPRGPSLAGLGPGPQPCSDPPSGPRAMDGVEQRAQAALDGELGLLTPSPAQMTPAAAIEVHGSSRVCAPPTPLPGVHRTPGPAAGMQNE